MKNWTQVTYEYDGSFAGFLSCVFESYVNREEGVCFLTDEDVVTLWPTRRVETNETHARRVYRSIPQKISPAAADLIRRAFLTCLPEREVHMFRFLQLGYERGGAVMRDLADDRVAILNKAVGHLNREAHLLTGFVRFSEHQGVLLAEIEPKNRVLPLLRGHFTARYGGERFLIYDRTHHEALVSQPGFRAIVPMDDFTPAPAGEEELEYRRLWRRFYDTIAIQGRYNPRCRMTHMPKRYWATMTEFQEETPASHLTGLEPKDSGGKGATKQIEQKMLPEPG